MARKGTSKDGADTPPNGGDADPRAVGPSGFRRHGRARIAGLAVSVASPALHGSHHTVLDLSAGGMRLAELDLPVGATFEFVLEGRSLDCKGYGHVVYRAGEAAGIAVDRWLGSDGDDVSALVMSKLVAEMSWNEPYISDWG